MRLGGATEELPPWFGGKRHINPDATRGGWVSLDSLVSPTAWLDFSCEVYGESVIEQGCVIRSRSKIVGATLEEGVLVDANSTIESVTIRKGFHTQPNSKFGPTNEPAYGC